MKHFNLSLWRYGFILILLFSIKQSVGQSISIDSIEKDIVKKNLLAQNQRQLDKLKQQAQKSGDDVLYARTLAGLLRIRDLRTEDTLYFRNSAFIDSLLQQPASHKLKAILHIMQAKRIGFFTTRYNRFNVGAYRKAGLMYNYAALSSQALDSVTNYHLEQALKYNDSTTGDNLLWLSSNPGIFLFKPTLTDIALSERVNIRAMKPLYGFTAQPAFTTWQGLSSAEFIEKIKGLKNENTTYAQLLTAYYQWIQYHQADAATSTFIESLARKYLFTFVSYDTVLRNSYQRYLLSGTASPYNIVKAHAVYQLCLMWNEDGNKYANWGGRYDYNGSTAMQPQYQFHPAKALKLYRENKSLLDQYPAFRALRLMELQITAKQVRIQLDDAHLPGQEIPFRLIYRNTDSLYYRVVRLNVKEASSLAHVGNIENRTAVQEGIFRLPLPADYNKHAVYLKLGGLPAGQYRLFFSANRLQPGSNVKLHGADFTVSNIAAVNSDTRVFVLNRKTGRPLAGAQVTGYNKISRNQQIASNKVAADGHIDITAQAADSLLIIYKGDTIGYRFAARKFDIDNETLEKDDDPADFYEDKLRMAVYTDRGIYRPGQTVHYKVILLTNHPVTGAPVLFNKETVGNAVYTELIKKWRADGDDLLFLKNPFNKDIDSARISVNEFGSFAGSFVIPKTAATGEWQIESDIRLDNTSNNRFKVEEYKRPTIELTAQKQSKMLLPGQPFQVKVKLRSFSGADLNNVPVKYTVKRGGNIPQVNAKPNQYPRYQQVQLVDTTGYTNAQGELLIPVADTALAHAKLPDSLALNFDYTINATAVDATGESTALSERVNVSTWPVKILINNEPSYNRKDLKFFSVSTRSDFEGSTNHPVRVKLYRISNPARTGKAKQTDMWVYAASDWNNWFPDKAELPPVKPEETLVLDTTINTGNTDKLTLPPSIIKTGFYKMLGTVTVSGRQLGKTTVNFNVFDSQTGETPTEDFDYLPQLSVKAGETITWYTSATKDSYAIYQALYVQGNKTKAVQNIYQTRNESTGLNTWRFKVPANIYSQILLTRISVADNKLFQKQRTLYVTHTIADQPEIIIEKYRKVMTPGAQETFTLSVKTKNDKVAAELMTTLYDASLDKLAGHQWQVPFILPRQHYIYNQWPYQLAQTRWAGEDDDERKIVLQELAIAPGQVMHYDEVLQGRAPGLSVGYSTGLNEVVIGYGAQAKRSLTGSVSKITLRGNSSLASMKQSLIILDGKEFTGNLNDLNANGIADIKILTGADASALYGSRGAQGVLIISTKGPIVLPEPEPQIKVRKDFNETAFFFPQVHAGTDGYYTINFTMPETATEWHWKILAHTSKTRFTYVERTLQTQLNLMVQPNMPRLLYQGDRLTLQSRISNLDTVAVKGKVTCKIEDAVTGEDITAKLIEISTQPFSLNKKSNGAVGFMLKVPDEQLNPLKVIVSAVSGSTGDAEEHTLPVLSPKVFVRQSQRVQFASQPTLSLTPAQLPAHAALYGVSVSVNQKPQASLINALPWLANYSYDCAEQTFNKIRALAAGLRLMQQDTLARQSFKNAATSINQEKPKVETLPDEMAEVTMPWLGIGNQTERQQKKLFRLLDTAATKATINTRLERLYKLQQPDGGLAWFDGGKSSLYISSYVLAGFGQLKQLGWKADPGKVRLQDNFIKSLLKYHDALIVENVGNAPNIYAVYAISYWLGDYPLTNVSQQQINSNLENCWKMANRQGLGFQALLISSTLRYAKPGSALYQKAEKQLENISQLAINDTQNGMRWKAIADNEDLDFTAEETMALVAEAFAQSGKYKTVQPGVVKWLLSARQDDHWQTTKATAAAIDLLQKEKGTAFGENKAFTAEVSGQKLAVSDDLLSGVPMAFAPLKEQPSQINLQQIGTNSAGAITWYYFAMPDRLDTLNKSIKINKQLYKQEDGKGWQPITAGTALNAGDKVRVKLTIDASVRLKFVHISDPRAAAFEPADNNSGYRYSAEFGYYQSVRDTGLELFSEVIPKGISEISYELVVAHSGAFISGPAHLQCMYKPEISAYSKSQSIKAE